MVRKFAYLGVRTLRKFAYLGVRKLRNSSVSREIKCYTLICVKQKIT